ncbi:dynactin subunit 6 isoform X1 [Anabrus simplex]|uniref:dynactin subunit 6 isoform X1 n=1 Tax=Anabrus simplex TaxID=316456 RepID=UPI0035A3AF45
MSKRSGNTVCCVVGFKNRYCNTEQSVKFYSFPSRPHEIDLKKQWILAVNRKNLKTASGAVVSSGHYPIIIGSNTLIHTGAAIIAEAGPITIGTNNIIEERAVIINRMPRGGTPSSARVIIGNNNIFNVDSHSEALKIGNNNILGPKSFVGREVELTHNCIVGPSCVMTCPELISPNSVVCGHQCT